MTNRASSASLLASGPPGMAWIASAVLAVLAGLVIAVWIAHEMLTGPGVQDAPQTFDPLIREAALRHGISPCLIKAVILKESGFDPGARGDAGEIGLMQVTVGAAEDWVRHHKRSYGARGMLFAPRLNIEVGTWYLAKASRRWRKYRQADVLMLAQYNAGPSNARRWAPEDPREKALERVRFPSTRTYISTVLEYRDEFEKKFLADETAH